MSADVWMRRIDLLDAEQQIADTKAAYDVAKQELEDAEARMRHAYMNHGQARWDLRMAEKEAL